ncbi:hypothetical protein [Limoniibacter endophyticus]|uniref:Outer membrane lipoprotein Omp16 n=1 Tax=Limoniibacter endophyticus TaxID=1565040 RepID=A0A8J3GH45_9HYPH|nr:hypothetical protein [Limoniibacter endophyticus]GHC64284.1 outer membrane lipoprotein Omp16 [Limoniibacter endophyticus]
MKKLIPLGIIALALAGCVGDGPSRPVSMGPGANPAPQRSPFDGNWMGADGVAVSTLNNGRFESRTQGTGELLTTGNYTPRDPRTIDLSFYSIKSQQNTQATCALVSDSQMNCTLANGNNFVLTRRA